MIRIIVDNDIVSVPVPVAGISKIIGCNAEVKSVEPETVWPTACQSPNVTRTKAAREAPMCPRMIQVIVGIIPSAVVSYPASIGMDVRRVRVSLCVAVVWVACRAAPTLVSAPFPIARRTLLHMPLGVGSRTMCGHMSTCECRASAVSSLLASAVLIVLTVGRR